MTTRPTWAGAMIAVMAIACTAIPVKADEGPNPLTRLSLEYLMDVEVVTASKRPERLQDTAAAVYVLTREEIIRSGATNIPDALRLVPGVNVAQINANNWAVSIRGLNSRYANKLLVMIDGRSIYSPLFSGVIWDRHRVPLSEIDRIEVVRGPGGSLWGANAVNGVINVITRHSVETQGQQLNLTVGTEELGRVYARQGSVLGEDATYRLSIDLGAHDDTSLPDGTSGNDDWEDAQLGLRVDWSPSERDTVLVDMGLSGVSGGDRAERPSLTTPYMFDEDGDTRRHGGYVHGRWERRFAPKNMLTTQAFVDYRSMEIDTPQIEEDRATVDVQVQHTFPVSDGLTAHYGGGYRYIDDRTDTQTRVLELHPDDDTIEIFSGFLQATQSLWDDQVSLTLGSKVEHHSVSGTEVQPSARALWNITDRHTLWGAVSQAVRTPSRAETDGVIRNNVIAPFTGANTTPFPLVVAAVGSDDLDAERITAFEAGYRARLFNRVSIDVAGFYNEYDALLVNADAGEATLESENGVPFLEVPASINDDAHGRVYGAEISATWEPTGQWRLRGSYSWLMEDIEDADTGATGNSPKHQLAVLSLFEISDNWTLDAALRLVDDLPNPDADGYADLDIRLAWSPNETIEFAVTGQNLLRDSRREYGLERELNPDPLATEIDRGVLATLTVRF